MSTIAAPSTPLPWLHPDQVPEHTSLVLACAAPYISPTLTGDNATMTELVNCCRELEEGQRAWESHKKESAWRLRRIELQLESKKSSRRREKMAEIEAKVKSLREEQKTALERIESGYRDQLTALKSDAEAKDQKLAEQWAAKHSQLAQFLQHQHQACRWRVVDSHGR